MFSQGQWIFTGLFIIAFVLLIIYSYRKDLHLHKKYYKGSFYVLFAFLFFIGLLFFLKYYLNF